MVHIRHFERNDFDAVKDIYQQGIDSGNATFQNKTKDWHEWNDSMLAVCRLVAIENDCVVGWAALSPVSSRPVYSGVAEVSVYVADHAQGKGVGHKLLSQLITESESNNIWTLQAGIFPENENSIFLHIRNNFRIIGTREILGKMKDVWRNVVFMEKRSKVVDI